MAGESLRDNRLDFFRGLALIVIFINHVPGNALTPWTWRNFGFSDAAELFIFISGYCAALAYGKIFDRDGIGAGVKRVGRRIGQIYGTHLLVLVSVAVASGLAAEISGHVRHVADVALSPLLSAPGRAVLEAVFLRYLPHYLDILPLYICLLGAFPVLFLLARRHAVLALGLSGALYGAALLFHLNLPAGMGRVWFFSPFAWQFLFTLGLVLGQRRRSGMKAPSSPVLFWGAVAFLIYAFFSSAVAWRYGFALRPEYILSQDKTFLAPARILHFLALAVVVSALLPSRAAFLQWRTAQPLLWCGKNALPIFALGTVLSALGRIAISELGAAWPVQIVVNGAGVVLLLLAGWALERRKTRAEPVSLPSGFQLVTAGEQLPGQRA